MSQLSLSNVHVSLERHPVLQGLTVDFPPSAFVAVTGPSGCGKSTLLRAIAGLTPLSEGEIWLDRQRLTPLKPSQRSVAMVFQNYALYPHMTVLDNMAYALKLQGMPHSQRLAAVTEVAKQLQIAHLLARKPSQLSGGQKQRVAMGRALVKRPKLFLFDEVLSNLDPALRHQMRCDITEWHRQSGATSLYVTHDCKDAMVMADRVWVLNPQGQTEQLASPDTLYHKPATRFVAELLSDLPMNFFSGVLDQGVLSLTLGDQTLRFATSDRRSMQVAVGVRPEDMVILPNGNHPVVLNESLGHEHVLHVMLANQQRCLLRGKGCLVQRVERLGVGVTAASLHLFDSSSGKRLSVTFEPSSSLREALPCH